MCYRTGSSVRQISTEQYLNDLQLIKYSKASLMFSITPGIVTVHQFHSGFSCCFLNAPSYVSIHFFLQSLHIFIEPLFPQFLILDLFFLFCQSLQSYNIINYIYIYIYIYMVSYHKTSTTLF